MSLFAKLVVSLLPLVPKAIVRPFARRYVAGETQREMLDEVRRLNARGVLCTVDVLGEFISRKEEATAAAQQYKEILAAIEAENLNANVSVKLSQMGLLLDPEFCYEVMRDLVATAQRHGNFVRIDMEDSACTTATIQLYLRLRREFSNVGIVLQAYLRRTMADAREIIEAGAGHFRLCKGIYVEPREIAYKDKFLINRNFAWVLEEMIQRGAYVGIATHDEKLVWEAQRIIDQYHLPREAYEFQMLLGVEPELREIVLNAGHRLRVYVPFGKEWHAYCIRRFKENPAIVSYVLQNLWESIFKPRRAEAPRPTIHLEPHRTPANHG